MQEDKNAEKRYQYGQQIMQTESRIDELHAEKRQIQEQIESLYMEMRQGCNQLQDLNEELNVMGNNEAYCRQEENEQNTWAVNQMLEAYDLDMEELYGKEVHNMEEKCTQLEKERGELPWD